MLWHKMLSAPYINTNHGLEMADNFTLGRLHNREQSTIDVVINPQNLYLVSQLIKRI